MPGDKRLIIDKDFHRVAEDLTARVACDEAINSFRE